MKSGRDWSLGFSVGELARLPVTEQQTKEMEEMPHGHMTAKITTKSLIVSCDLMLQCLHL